MLRISLVSSWELSVNKEMSLACGGLETLPYIHAYCSHTAHVSVYITHTNTLSNTGIHVCVHSTHIAHTYVHVPNTQRNTHVHVHSTHCPHTDMCRCTQHTHAVPQVHICIHTALLYTYNLVLSQGLPPYDLRYARPPSMLATYKRSCLVIS